MAEIRRLRYFVAVAERLSFSRAALDLHISQPALSEAVRKVEVELGVELLERSSRGVALTGAGETLLHEAREVLARLDDAVLRTREAARGRAGRPCAGGPPGALDPRPRRRADHVDAARPAVLGRLVGGQPAPRRLRAPVGPGERQRRGDARAGGRGHRLLHRDAVDDRVLQ